MKKAGGSPQITPHDPEHLGSRRDPEERPTTHAESGKEKTFDKTLADSFPTSDPPSTIPDPGADAAKPVSPFGDPLLKGLKAGTWAAISIDHQKIVGTGATQKEAEQDAKKRKHSQIQLIQVPDGKQ